MGTNKTTPSFPLLIMNIKLLSAATAAVLVSGSATLITTAAAEARPQTLASPQAMASMLASPCQRNARMDALPGWQQHSHQRQYTDQQHNPNTDLPTSLQPQ